MLDLVEDDVKAVTRMIQFLYLGDYDDSNPPTIQSLVPVKEPLIVGAPSTPRRHPVIVRCFDDGNTPDDIRVSLSQRGNDIQKFRVVGRNPMKSKWWLPMRKLVKR